MEQKIDLHHPGGKKAISMDKEKYETVKNSLIRCLNDKNEVTQNEMERFVTKDLEKRKINFKGSIQWHLEWVKLDCEAKKLIKRTSNKTPLKYALSN